MFIGLPSITSMDDHYMYMFSNIDLDFRSIHLEYVLKVVDLIVPNGLFLMLFYKCAHLHASLKTH
jgi:hypothetical protein